MKTKFEQLFDNADQMAPDMNAVYEAGMELVNKYKWISVEDRLPENPILDFVIVGRDSDGGIVMVMEAQYIGDMKFMSHRFGLFKEIVNVTHWMPLPEPPEESE